MGNFNGLRCQWFATIGGLGRQRLRVLVPRPVGWGGELSDSVRTIGDEKQRPVPRLLYRASGAPPPNVAENNNIMTFRRIYNKAIYFIKMSVFFETGEVNTFVYDSGGLYRRKYA